MILNIPALLEQGRKKQQEAYKEKDAGKLGFLRGGNSGVMNASGQVAGACHRVAHLRSLGISLDEHDDSQQQMFEFGIKNEDVVYDNLVRTLPPGYSLLREEEIPTEWQTTNGTKVTGRPDMVYMFEGKPVHLLELKSVASVWTTLEVMSKQKPKVAHLAQAGHYMWQLGVPYGTLLYRQYANQAMPDFGQKLFPQPGDEMSGHLKYAISTTKQGVKKVSIQYVRPYTIGYLLRWDSTGQLEYIQTSKLDSERPDSGWTKTVVSKEDLERFYEFTSRIAESGDLGPIPITIDATGEEKAYSNCKYCPLQKICRTQKAKKLLYEEWLQLVKKEVENGFPSKKED
jgi:hypothetical protein